MGGCARIKQASEKNRLEVCLSLLLRHKGKPFLHHIVTCNKKSILFDNRKHSAQ